MVGGLVEVLLLEDFLGSERHREDMGEALVEASWDSATISCVQVPSSSEGYFQASVSGAPFHFNTSMMAIKGWVRDLEVSARAHQQEDAGGFHTIM